jgi:putative membrane protein
MRALAIATAGLMALSVPAFAQGGTAGVHGTAQGTTRKSDAVQKFVDKAAMINMFEINAAHAAEQKTSNSDYKSYANMIVTDHSNMESDLKRQVADISGVTIPKKLDEAHARKLDSLKSESGASFEKSYRQGQIDGHKQAVSLFQDFANSEPKNQDVDLKSWAKASVPILQKHLQRAEALPVGGQQVGAAAPSSNAPATAQSGNRNSGVTTGNAQSANENSAQNLVDERCRSSRRWRAIRNWLTG